MQRKQRYVAALLWVTSLCVALSACGFKLRTWELEANVSSAAITGAVANAEVGTDLRRALAQAGVELVDAVTESNNSQNDKPDITVALLDIDKRQRSISVTGQARAAEYELLLGLNYSVVDAKSSELITPRWIRTQRIYRVDRNNLVGSNEEGRILEREMRTDIVQQILRAINQVTQSQPNAS